MFTGEFRHSLDQKGRLVLPSEVRAVLAEEGAVITKSNVGRYLVGFTRTDFDRLASRLAEQLAKDPQRRMVERRWFASSRPAVVDRTGRILIPQNLRDHAQMTTDVMVVGVNDHFQLWDAELYDAENARAEALIPEIAANVPELSY